MFERVDFKYIVDFALKSRMLGAKHFLLVSAMGADSSSKIFYNRVKGKTEEIVKRMEFEQLTQKDKMKYEIAEELGLLDKVKESGWKSLSAKESGRIGGIMTNRIKKMKAKEEEQNQSQDSSK